MQPPASIPSPSPDSLNAAGPALKTAASELVDRRVDVLLQQTPVALFNGMLAGAFMVIIFWHGGNHRLLLSWLGIYTALNLGRYGFVKRALRRGGAKVVGRRAFRDLLIGNGLSGILWGLFGMYLVRTGDPTLLPVVVLALGGMVAAAVSVYSVSIQAFCIFSLPAMLPPALWLLLQDNGLQTYMGGLALLFLLVIVMAEVRLNRLVLRTLDMEFRNIGLVNQLRDEELRISKLNRTLEKELSALKKTEDELRAQKLKAEDMADKLLTLSSQDGLTGVANRRSFDQTLAREWGRLGREARPLALILCDIDYFKAYNDRYGHQKGDHCLMRVAATLEEYARRGGDLAARYGGEEFAVILSNTDLDGARALAEQMRQAVEQLRIRHESSAAGGFVTVSFGVAALVPQRGLNSANLISLADRALYAAKQAGRNRVVVHEGDVAMAPRAV